MKQRFSSKSITFRSGMITMTGLGIIIILFIFIVVLNIRNVYTAYMQDEDQKRLNSVVLLLDEHFEEYSAELSYEAGKTVLLQALATPQEADIFLQDLWSDFYMSELNGIFYLTTPGGEAIADSSLEDDKPLPDIYFYDFFETTDNRNRVFMTKDYEMAVFVAPVVKGVQNVVGYLMFCTDFTDFFDATRSYMDAQGPDHAFSAYIENKNIVETKTITGEKIVTRGTLESLPIAIEMYTPMYVINNPITQLARRILLSAIFAGIITTILLTFIVYKTMALPLRNLTEGIADIGSGKKTSLSVTAKAADEIVYLAEAFNEMQKSLDKRNSQIEQSNQSLIKANNNLRETQQQLIQSEKLASIGQLAAGVAHEINNPTGYVFNNLVTLQEYLELFKSLYSLIEKAVFSRSSGDDKPLDEALDEAKEILKDDDTHFIMSDINDLLQESIIGTNKIRDIVQGLKNFARTDNFICRPGDVNKSITDALQLTRNELKYNCEIITDLQPLPTINCMVDKLTQVFVNLLINAGNAIEEQGKIYINSFCDEEWITVKVEDTGMGIPEKNMGKLFDPFFTTKEIGKGTGLGLSISLGIIENHNGTITVESKVGKGTCFTIQLPIEAGCKDDE